MKKWIGIGLAVIVLITIAFIVAAYIYPDFREATRDIAVVILAVFQMIGAILTAVLLIAILYAVSAVQRLTNNTIVPKVDMLTAKLDGVIENTRAAQQDPHRRHQLRGRAGRFAGDSPVWIAGGSPRRSHVSCASW